MPDRSTSAKSTPNVILIVIDTLRARNMGAYGHRRPTTPVLDRHAAGGTRFSRAYAETIPTQPSFTSLLTGTSPNVNNVVSHVLWKNAEQAAKDQSTFVLPGQAWRDRMPKITPEVRMVGALMQAKGYYTCAVDNLVKMRSHFQRGWDEYVYSSESNGEDKRFAVAADDINFHALPLLDRVKDERFFLFLHYWDPHAPYEPPAEFQGFMREAKDVKAMRDELVIGGLDLSAEDFIFIAKADRDVATAAVGQNRTAELLIELEARYDGEIAYVDNRLGRVFEHLEKLGLDEDTVVIITSDHGESFGSHNTLGHSGLHETVTRVPLWFRGPGVPTGKVIDSCARHVDIVPTIMDLAGIEPDIAYSLSGATLKPVMEGASESATDAVCCVECSRQKTRSILCGRWKLIRALDDLPRVDHLPDTELYDLDTDPHERRDVADQRPHIVSKLERELDERVGTECREVGRAKDVALTSPLTSDLGAYDNPARFAFSLTKGDERP